MTRRQELITFEANDYYAYLNLDQDASASTTRQHYRQLALQWHPDKHPEGEARSTATDIFQRINEAQEVLLDADKRHRYNDIWCKQHRGKTGRVPRWAQGAGRRRASQEPAPGSRPAAGGLPGRHVQER